uniref:Uncharacterized protein n=1 Tax=Cacopsylla melanoneura TaxID=428564 RepID=A0A8D8LJH0_9HEMI
MYVMLKIPSVTVSRQCGLYKSNLPNLSIHDDRQPNPYQIIKTRDNNLQIIPVTKHWVLSFFTTISTLIWNGVIHQVIICGQYTESITVFVFIWLKIGTCLFNLYFL